MKMTILAVSLAVVQMAQAGIYDNPYAPSKTYQSNPYSQAKPYQSPYTQPVSPTPTYSNTDALVRDYHRQLRIEQARRAAQTSPYSNPSLGGR